jgi:hypothetical protein
VLRKVTLRISSSVTVSMFYEPRTEKEVNEFPFRAAPHCNPFTLALDSAC